MNFNGFPESKRKYQISVNLWGGFSYCWGEAAFCPAMGSCWDSIYIVLRDSGLMTGLERVSMTGKPVPSLRKLAGPAYSGQGGLMCHMTLGL